MHDSAAQQGLPYNPLQHQSAHMHMLAPTEQNDSDLPWYSLISSWQTAMKELVYSFSHKYIFWAYDRKDSPVLMFSISEKLKLMIMAK